MMVQYNEMRCAVTNAVDSDGDGLSDAEEVDTHMTDPLLPDTDGDGLEDGAELIYNTNPNSVDSDQDGLEDGHQKIQAPQFLESLIQMVQVIFIIMTGTFLTDLISE